MSKPTTPPTLEERLRALHKEWHGEGDNCAPKHLPPSDCVFMQAMRTAAAIGAEDGYARGQAERDCLRAEVQAFDGLIDDYIVETEQLRAEVERLRHLSEGYTYVRDALVERNALVAELVDAFEYTGDQSNVSELIARARQAVGKDPQP
jgi:hypothetical protein